MNAQTCFDHFYYLISLFAFSETTPLAQLTPTHIILGKMVNLIIHDGFLAK